MKEVADVESSTAPVPARGAICDGIGMYDKEGCDRSCFYFWTDRWSANLDEVTIKRSDDFMSDVAGVIAAWRNRETQAPPTSGRAAALRPLTEELLQPWRDAIERTAFSPGKPPGLSICQPGPKTNSAFSGREGFFCRCARG